MRHQIADDRAQQDRQHADQPFALQVDREGDRDDQGDEGDRPVGAGHAQRRACQGDTDDDRHAAGDDRRQDLIQRLLADRA